MRTQVEYTVENHRCPACDSDRMVNDCNGEGLEYNVGDSNRVFSAIGCSDCGFRWHEDYVLVGYWPRVGHGDDDNGPDLLTHLKRALREKCAELERLRERIDALIDLIPTSDYFDTVLPALVEAGLMWHHTDCPEGGENFMWIDGEICHACGSVVSE